MKQGLWIISSNQALISVFAVAFFKVFNFFSCHFEHHKLSVISFHCIGGKTDIPRASYSKILQLTPT